MRTQEETAIGMKSFSATARWLEMGQHDFVPALIIILITSGSPTPELVHQMRHSAKLHPSLFFKEMSVRAL